MIYNVRFDGRFLKELLRERLLINSVSWDFKKCRELSTLLGQRFLNKQAICKQLSSALINNFRNVYSFMLNNTDDFLNYTKFGLKTIWIPKMLLRILKLTLTVKLRPFRIENEIVSFNFKQGKVVFPKVQYELNNIIGDTSTIPEVKEFYDPVTEPVFIESLVSLNEISYIAFRSSSVDVGNYEQLTEINEEDWFSVLMLSTMKLNSDDVVVYGNEKLTREQLFINILSGLYFEGVEFSDDVFLVNEISMEKDLVVEELRLFIESQFAERSISKRPKPSKVDKSVPEPVKVETSESST